MQTITMYRSNDGSVHETPEAAARRDAAVGDLIPFYEMPVNALALEDPPLACPYVVRLPQGFTWLGASGGDTDTTTWRAEEFDWSFRGVAGSPPRVRVVALNIKSHAEANKVIRSRPMVEPDFSE